MVDEDDLKEARARLRALDIETLMVVIQNHKALGPLLREEAVRRLGVDILEQAVG